MKITRKNIRKLLEELGVGIVAAKTLTEIAKNGRHYKEINQAMTNLEHGYNVFSRIGLGISDVEDRGEKVEIKEDGIEVVPSVDEFITSYNEHKAEVIKEMKKEMEDKNNG